MLSNPNIGRFGTVDSGPKSFFRHPIFYSSAVLALVALYVGWIVFSRWSENRDIDRRAVADRAAKQREKDRATVEQMGGKSLAIMMFYASPSVISRGETSELCYGVTSAKDVKLEPQDSPVWPSPSRCVEVSPTKTTTYTLTAGDGAGGALTQTLEIKVR